MSDKPLNNEQIEPSSPLPINTTGSDPSNMPSEAPESPKNADIPVSLNNDNPENSPVLTPSPEEAKPAESGSVEVENPKNEPISEPVQTSETRTAQMAGNEPLAEPEQTETSASQLTEPKLETSKPMEATPPLAVKNFRDATHENLAKAQLTIQNKKRKKLDLILTLFAKRKNITNNEVEKLLHVSDATVTRYLSILEKEGKIKQNGKTGQMVSYSRI